MANVDCGCKLEEEDLTGGLGGGCSGGEEGGGRRGHGGRIRYAEQFVRHLEGRRSSNPWSPILRSAKLELPRRDGGEREAKGKSGSLLHG